VGVRNWNIYFKKHRGYMSRDTRMRNDDLAFCLWAHDVWGGISRKPLEIETWVQRTTNRKWTIASPMVTWSMTSRDPERSGSGPQYVWCPLSRKRLEIATWWQWSAYRKWPLGIEWSRDRWRHLTLKGQGHDLDICLPFAIYHLLRLDRPDGLLPISTSVASSDSSFR